MKYLDILNRRGIRASTRKSNTLWLNPQYLVIPDIAETVRSHKDDVLAEICGCAVDASNDLSETVPDYHILMVATNLDSWEANDPRFGYEVMLDTCYRQLDAHYYAWLRHRMENARKSHGNGSLDDVTYNAMREQFNVIHTWAVIHIGEDVLRMAIRTANIKTYIPPSEQTFAAYRKTWDDAWEAYQRRVAAQSYSTPSDQAGKLMQMLATSGYAIIKSGVINDVIIFVRDETIVVPDQWARKVRYTMDELTLMIGSAPEAVKQLHDVKRIFGGTVVPIEESDNRTLR
ncbi:MAG: hypothetical protein NT018_00160 [Armatimonadetes bacterium]|nr:hypothetical protein [Armatimonadota bacterium]